MNLVQLLLSVHRFFFPSSTNKITKNLLPGNVLKIQMYITTARNYHIDILYIIAGSIHDQNFHHLQPLLK